MFGANTNIRGYALGGKGDPFQRRPGVKKGSRATVGGPQGAT